MSRVELAGPLDGDLATSRLDAPPLEWSSAGAPPNENSPDMPSSPSVNVPNPEFVPSPSVKVQAAATSQGIVERLRGRCAIANDLIEPRLPLLVTLWLLGVIGGSMRPAFGLWMHWQFKTRGLTRVPGAAQVAFDELVRRMGVHRAVAVAESALVKVPLVVGYLRPVVLLPATVLTGLTAPQLEAVLAHELAHVRRHDWIVNSLQVLVETLLFFHPAVWWLSRRIHHERELCCDDLALSIVGDRATYGRALLALEELRQRAPAPLLAATGGDLLARVQRLLPDEPRASRATRSWIGGLSLVVVLVAAATITLLTQTPAQSMNVATAPPAQNEPSEAAPPDQDDASRPATSDAESASTKTLRQPQLLLPDHWIMQAVEFDREGKELITASLQSGVSVRRWEIASQKLLSEIKLQADKHGRAFRQGTLRFSGDRRRLVAATDEYVGIWDATTGKLLKQLPFPKKEGIYECAIDLLDCTPDLSVIVGHRALPGRLTLSYDAHILVWDGDSGALAQTVIDKGATDLKTLDLSTDGTLLVTSNGNGARIWDPKTGTSLRSIANDNTGRKHSDPDVSSQYTSHVWSVQFSPDGKQVAVGDILGVKLFEPMSGHLLRQLEGPYRYSSSASPGLIFSQDGERLARLGTQEKVEGESEKHRYVVPIWSTRTGMKSFVVHTEANDATFSADGRSLAVVFSDMQQALSLWQLEANDKTSLSKANDKERPPGGPGPHSRQDRVEENGHHRGAKAAEFIAKFQPTWGEPKLGIQYGVAFTKQPARFRRGERVTLVYFFRNASDKPVSFETSPDYHGNAPAIVNARGESVAVTTVPLLGDVARYVELLQPGEALGPFYSNVGLGENPRPHEQHWSPYQNAADPGSYKIVHTASLGLYEKGQKNGQPERISTPTLTFEIAAEDEQRAADDTGAAVKKAAESTESRWGAVTNGLRMRVVPVEPGMKDEEIQLGPNTTTFETLDDVTLAVEIENVSDFPVSLRDVRYGAGYGEASGKLDSAWFGQFLFSVDYYDAAGKLSERAKLIPVKDEWPIVGDALTTKLPPKQTLKMLLRPDRWLSALSQQPLVGPQRAVVKYRGTVAGAGNDVLRDVEASAVEFTVRKRGYRPSGVASPHLSDDPKDDPELAADIVPQLKWGQPVNGLRAALDLVPESRGKGFSHGTKPKLKMVVQNVSDKPLTLASLMWLSELPIKVTNSQGAAIDVRSTWYTGITPVIRVLLSPQQIVTFDAGNLGLAVTKERAEKFEDVTHRTLVAPQGKYSLSGSERFGMSFQLKDGDGKVLVPQEGDFKAELTTGAAQLDLSNEVIECEIRDAVTGQLVEGTSVNFRIVKPKTANSDELTVAILAWAPKAPSRIYFVIPNVPEDVAQRPDRDELEIRFGVGGHDDYEPYAPQEGIPLKQFFHDGPQQAKQILSQIKLTPKKRSAKSESRPTPLPDAFKKLEGQGISAIYDETGEVISIYLGRPTTDALLAELTSLPHLRELHVETTQGVTEKGLASLSKLKRLEKASFYNVNETKPELGDSILRAVVGLTTLRDLTVSECGTTDDGCKVLTGMTQLTSLSLHQEGRLTDAALASVGTLRQLKSLSLGSVVATERLGRMQFSAAGIQELKGLSQLEALNLEGHPVTTDVLASNRLRSVSLGHPSVDDKVAKRLSELSDLQQLRLSFTSITDVGLRQLGALKQLRNLDCGSHVITDAGVAAFENHPTLSYVNLRMTKLTDAAVKSVATMPQLANLSLWRGADLASDPAGPSLTLAGLRPLVDAPNLRVLSFTNWRANGGWLALREFKQLDQLSFTMCDVPQTEVDALDDAMPDTLIANATGSGGVLRPATLEKQRRLFERARQKAAERQGRDEARRAAERQPNTTPPAEGPGWRSIGIPVERHSEPPYELQFASESWLVSAGQDDARVWDREKGKLAHILPHGKGRMIRGLAVSPDQRLIVTSGFDDELGIWERSSGKRLHTLKGHGAAGGSRVTRFTSDGRQLVSWGDDAHLRRWDVQKGTLLAEHDLRLPGFAEQGQLGAISAGMFGTIARDAKSLFVRFQEELIEFDTLRGEIVRRVDSQLDQLPLAASPEGNWLAGIQSQRNERREVVGAHIVLLDRATLQSVRQWPVTEPGSPAADSKLPRPIFVGGGDRTLTFSPDGRQLAWCQSGALRQIVIADVGSERITHRITSPSAACCIEFSPEGQQIASGHLDSTITIWNWQHPSFLAVNGQEPRQDEATRPKAGPSRDQAIRQDPPRERTREPKTASTVHVTSHSFEVKLVGAPNNEPLGQVKVEITSGHGSDLKRFGSYVTDKMGLFQAKLPVGFYYLHLSSENEWPYLKFEKFWGENGQGQSRSLNLRIVEEGVEKWLGGERRERGFEAATNERPARITYSLQPAT